MLLMNTHLLWRNKKIHSRIITKYFLTLVMLNKKMPHPLLIFSQSDYLILVVDTNSNTKRQMVQIQLIWICTVCKSRAYLGLARQGRTSLSGHLEGVPSTWFYGEMENITKYSLSSPQVIKWTIWLLKPILSFFLLNKKTIICLFGVLNIVFNL